MLDFRFSCNDYEEYYLVGYDTMYSGNSLLTFQRSVLPSSSGLKSKHATKYSLLHNVNYIKTLYFPNISMIIIWKIWEYISVNLKISVLYLHLIHCKLHN